MPTALESFLFDVKQARTFYQEHLLVEITELMCKMLKRQGVSRRELARRLDKNASQVNAILNGEANLTYQQIADVFTALGLELRVVAVPIQKRSNDLSKD
jgi:transcriptional regulator with XRE-family HTH domain